MHYQNGREVQVGDPVVGLVGNQKGTVGCVVDTISGLGSDKLQIAIFQTFKNHSSAPMTGNFVYKKRNGMMTSTALISGKASEFIHAIDVIAPRIKAKITPGAKPAKI